MSPEHLSAWIGLPTATVGLLVGALRVARKGFKAFDRVARAVNLIELRTMQLEHNGGSSLRDDAKAARGAAEAALAASERVETRLDRHLEQHSAAMPRPDRPEGRRR